MKQQIPNHITIYTKKITNSMYTYTQIEHKYTYRSNGLKSKINSIDQMSSENQTVHRKKSNKKKMMKSESSRSVTKQNLQNPS